MKFIIDKKIKSTIPSTKLFDLGTDAEIGINNLLDLSTINIDQNIIPILKINDSNYLINDWNSKNIKESVELNITEDDLITLGGSSEPVDSRPYKVYTALLTQSGTDAPVATVLENTLGNIVWSYDHVGTYSGTLLNAFTDDKVFLMSSHSDQLIVSDTTMYRIDINSITVETAGLGVLQDELLSNTSIEIRVYN